VTTPGEHTPESLGALLKDALLLAEAGQYEAALGLLMVHDAAVRAGAGDAVAAEIPRWRVLHAAQQRVAERLAAMRDAAGRELAMAGRARRFAEAYEQAS
jgi:hypothetical protein